MLPLPGVYDSPLMAVAYWHSAKDAALNRLVIPLEKLREITEK